MKEYFLLQYRMIRRHFEDFGLHPVPGLIGSLVAFLLLSAYLFDQTENAPWIYAAVALYFVSRLSEPARNNFLQTVFPENRYRRIRITENLAVALPFSLCLAWETAWIPLLATIAFSMALSVTRFGNRFSHALPTPFGTRPFEFPTGFRSSWPVLLAAFFLAAMSGASGNFNLGVFAQLVVLLTVFTYYLNPENEFYVWIFSLSPARFLAAKFRTAVIFTGLLCLPVIVVTGLFFPGQVLTLLAIQIMGSIFLAAVILAKYASFPGQISLPLFILLAFSVSFPPLLAALLPWLWIKSVNRLKEILA